MRLLPAVCVMLASVAGAQDGPGDAGAPPADLGAYVRALQSLAGDLEAGHLEDARRASQVLSTFEYEWAGESLHTDAALLADVARTTTSAEAPAVARRVRHLVACLASISRAENRPEHLPSVDVSALAAKDPLSAGGVVKRIKVEAPSVPERVALAILRGWDAFAEAVGDLWDRFWRWMRKLVPRKAWSLPGGRVGPVAIAFVVAVAVLLALLSIRALRRRGGARPSATLVSAAESVRDDDPLSRESNEWELHAQQLSTAGRWREAIRAWYHAVLVALFRAGLLHYKKGRTNWEYASRLGGDVAWRPAFFDLTSLFDREWYGRPASDAEAHRTCARNARDILEKLRRVGGAS